MPEEKNTLLSDFLKRLRIAVSNASIYSQGHHIAQKSFEELQASFERALAGQESLEMFIAPRYLLIKGQKWEKDPLYEDLARFFHQRCLKSIKWERGASQEEIAFFITKSVGRTPDLFKEGGLAHILQSKNIAHISVEMLDYSEILKGGKEDKDIWSYLLREAVEQKNLSQIDSLVDYYEQMIREIGIRDLLTTPSFQESVVRFLAYLKDTKEYAFRQCGKVMLQNLIRNAELIKGIALPQMLAASIDGLNHDEIADIVIQEFIKETKSAQALEYFADIFESERHKGIIDSLTDKLQHQTLSQVNRQGLQGFQALFSLSQHPVVATNYRPVISALLQEITPRNDFTFDKDALAVHFQNVLFFMLTTEQAPDVLQLVAEKIIKEFEQMPEQKQKDCFERTLQLLKGMANDPCRRAALDPLLAYIGHQIEREIVAGHMTDKLEMYSSLLNKSSLDGQIYLEAIFRNKTINPLIVKTFFKFFPGARAEFHQNLKKRLADTNFILRLMKNITGLEPAGQMDVLKVMFLSPNLYIRVEALRMMKTLPVIDKDFLFPILVKRADNLQLKETALEILAKQPGVLRAVFDKILTIDKAGRQNVSLLEENLHLIRKLGLREACDHLAALRKKLFPWQWRLKKEIAEILSEWGHG